MASIIKNQILKHLSRFVKDLSSDRINVHTFKGEGELTDLKLEEEVLTELLALPIWMRIKMAHCNRARLMIPWTKLKSIPIRLVLDHVEIHVEACSELRNVSTSSYAQLNVPSSGKYGFVNKVVDGITVIVDAVDIKFFSEAFESKIQISRIKVESKSPQWKRVELARTKLKDTERGELLLFKEIDWQTLRLEAQSTKERHLAPLRLITNQAKARVVIKKKLTDCSVVGCRLSLILDDLLWVLTDSQILAAAHFVSSLSGLVKEATETSQAAKAARKLETLPEYRAQQLQAAPDKLGSQTFEAFDVKETSYHLVCEKIDLHFCDDPGGGRSSHPDLKDGGAAQIQLCQLNIDFYPYHLANSSRRHWYKYNGSDLNHWLRDSLEEFRHKVMEKLFPKTTNVQTTTEVRQGGLNPGDRRFNSSGPGMSNLICDQLAKLMSTCLILKIQEVLVYKVTTLSREIPKPFLSSYIERPKDVASVNMEFTWFYYPGSVCFPLPPPKVFAQLHPLQLHIDVITILWFNSFVKNLQSRLPVTTDAQDPDYTDIRVEFILPKIVIEEKKKVPLFKERPDGLQIQTGRVLLANYRSGETGTVHQLYDSVIIFEKELSNEKKLKFPEISSKILDVARGNNTLNQRRVSGNEVGDSTSKLSTKMLWTDPRDIWFISVDAVGAEFFVDKSKSENEGLKHRRKFRPVGVSMMSEHALIPFIESLPLKAWMYIDEKPVDQLSSSISIKDIHLLLLSDKICNVQLTHPQYLFLLRTVEVFSEISLFLTLDTRKTYTTVDRRSDSIQLYAFLPNIMVSLLLPNCNNNIPRDNSSVVGDGDPDVLPDDNQSTFDGESKNLWDPSMNKQLKKNSIFLNPDSPEPDTFPSPTSNPLQMEPQMAMGVIKSSLTQGMKQGFSMVVSLSKQAGQSTPDSEAASLWSSDSSENNFIHLETNEDLSSPCKQDCDNNEAFEIAEEVTEDDSGSASLSIHNPYYKEDNFEINVVNISLQNVLVGQFAEDYNSRIYLVSRNIDVIEELQVTWKEFQTQFAQRTKKWSGTTGPIGNSESSVHVQFEQVINSKDFKQFLKSSNLQDALLQVKSTKNPRVNLIDRSGPESPIRQAINNCAHPYLEATIKLNDSNNLYDYSGKFVTLHDSTLTKLNDFFEDEIPPVVLPMRIHISGASFEIIEEKNPTLPPIKVCVQEGVTIRRHNLGMFVIGYASDSTNDLFTNHLSGQSKAKMSVDELQREISQLKRQISELERRKSLLANAHQSPQ